MSKKISNTNNTVSVTKSGRVKKTIDINSVKMDENVPITRIGGKSVYSEKLKAMKLTESFVIGLDKKSAVAGIASAMKKLGFKCKSKEMPPGTVEDLGNGKTTTWPEGGIRIHKLPRETKESKE